ncbi:MAG TPA: UDP-N-acetylglucosamine 2-epimerase (non-hydrolyzing) [Candidatus Dormibacteraeota bacterium]|nr:UDP-N-acetylglucosamine 2-epimerase (non-hydrolyzing) [Candidatus Dormibacteraeota bacterium]
MHREPARAGRLRPAGLKSRGRGVSNNPVKKVVRVLTVFGTRPEAIKLAPLIEALHRRPGTLSIVCVTGQHREMLDQVLKLFGIVPDHDLNLMRKDQTLPLLAASVFRKLAPILQSERPDWVVVQGDTTSAAIAALGAFYHRCKVAHVEAGLRSHDKWQPFPEEINRRITGVVADIHFAPTEQSRQNLLREGVPESSVMVTGNTIIDALHRIRSLPWDPRTLRGKPSFLKPSSGKLILVTVHRRENFGEPMVRICGALRTLAERYPKVEIVYPVHRNPHVWEPVHRLLGGIANVSLIPPVDYLTLVHLMMRSYIVVTDSGGIQEEAPSLGVPALVLREVTERPEGVESGNVKLLGSDAQRIVAETSRLLDDPGEHLRMARAVNPYGDGHAAERIASALETS